MSRWKVILALFFLSITCVRGQTSVDSAFDAVTRRGIHDVYNLEFEKAEEEFGELVRLRPGHPAGRFFLAMVQWWRILIDIDNEQYDSQFLSALDGVVDQCDSVLDKDPDDVTAIFFKGGAIGFQGRLRFHRDDYLAAANAGRKALPLIKKAMDLDPNDYDILLGTGMYNYYADVIPEEYPVVKPLLLFVPPGDKKKGIQQLKMAAAKGKYASVEASYFLMQLYYFYERDYQNALALAVELNTRFPDNTLFHLYVGRCYVAIGNYPMAQEVFTAIVERALKGQRGYSRKAEREAEYYLGACQMSTREYDSALRHFFRCDELSRRMDRNGPSGFMVMANLKAGMIYDLQSKRDLAVMQYKKVLGMKEYNNSSTQAEQFLKSPFAQ